jgi:hypothetical protein
MNKESEGSKMNDRYLKKNFSNQTTYKYYYQDDFYFNKGETLESLKNLTGMKVISLNDDCIGEVISYETQEKRYNCKADVMRDVTKCMGKVTEDIIYENTYDEKFNLTKKRLSRYSIDTGDDVVIYLYENIYDEGNRLIKIVKKKEDGDILETIHLQYSNERLIKKESKYGSEFYKHSNYYYNQEEVLYEQEVFICKELSYYYNYNILEDGRTKKILVNPARGKYKWKLEYGYEDKESCGIYMHEPLLTPDMIKEIMDYIILNYKDIINCVIIDILNMNLMFKDENFELYKYYYDNYGISILENF